jgi:CRP-like cAMP-binding protein
MHCTHAIDRGLRILGGVVLISLSFSENALAPLSRNVAVIVGIYSLLTGAFNICPLVMLILKEQKFHMRNNNAGHEMHLPEARGLDFLKELTDQEIERVLACCQLKEYPQDTVVINEGAQRQSLFIIVSGSCKVVKSVVGNETKTIATLAKGETFGEMSFFDQTPVCASIISLENFRVLELDDVRFSELVRDNQQLENKMLRRLLRTSDSRIRLLNEQITTLGRWVVKGRNNPVTNNSVTNVKISRVFET